MKHSTKKKDVRIIFCDISKAFDKVWHQGILYKLEKLGIKGNLLKWFKDYLENRLQRVIVKGCVSWWSLIEAGVPQGSVLGPLLFLIYINDLAEAVNCSIKMFADDTCLYVTVDDPEEAADTLNNELQSVHDWACQWIVNFNAAKTKSMIISNKNRQHPPIYFDGAQIENVSSHKHLGVVLSDNLNWTDHIHAVLKDTSKMIDVTRKLKFDLDRKSLETIYFSFIRPKLEYACQIWDNCCEREKDKMEEFQRSAARVVSGAKKGTSHELLYKEVCWATLNDRRKNLKLQLMHNIVHLKTPTYLSDALPSKVGENNRYRLRNNGHYELYACRTEKFQHSFFPDTIKLWNELNEEQKATQDKNDFKSRLNDTSGKSSELFNYGVRKYNIIHAQMRMKCSDLKAHLFALHVIDDPVCICNTGIEDTYHFFFQCPLYYAYRLDLEHTVNAISPYDYKVILYGDDNLNLKENQNIFTAVHTFIKSSGRFN